MRLTPFLLGRKAYTTIALDATVADIRSITRYSKQEWTVFKVIPRPLHRHPVTLT